MFSNHVRMIYLTSPKIVHIRGISHNSILLEQLLLKGKMKKKSKEWN